MAAQNALYPTDVGENEGMGFVYVSADWGIPWIVVRGISDSPWYPSTYHGVLASDRAAQVAASIIGHWPSESKLVHTVAFANLSPESQAKHVHYLVGEKAYYRVGSVTAIQYVNSKGQQTVVKNPNQSEYAKP